jgi:hypothetical protein
LLGIQYAAGWNWSFSATFGRVAGNGTLANPRAMEFGIRFGF